MQHAWPAGFFDLSFVQGRAQTRQTQHLGEAAQARAGPNVPAVALANKNARIIWALLTHGNNYRPSSPGRSGQASSLIKRSYWRNTSPNSLRGIPIIGSAAAWKLF